MKLKRKPVKRDFVNITAILILLGLIIWIFAIYTSTFGTPKGDNLEEYIEHFQQFILSYGNAGILVMIFLHALHVIVSIMPAAVFQFIGGVIYGMTVGMLTGVGGVIIGTAVSFYLSRFLGKQVITLFVSEKTLDKFNNMLSGSTSTLMLIILFTIPGFPKDFLPYFFGLTKIKARKFFLISAIGRLPGMFVSTYLGAHILSRNYVLIVSVTVIACASFLCLYIFRDKLLKTMMRRK